MFCICYIYEAGKYCFTILQLFKQCPIGVAMSACLSWAYFCVARLYSNIQYSKITVFLSMKFIHVLYIECFFQTSVYRNFFLRKIIHDCMITQIENVILIVVLIFQIFCFGVRLI